MPDDSRTEDSTVGGREDGRGFWKEGESMIVVAMGAPSGGGAKDGESIIIMGDWAADVSGTGKEPGTRMPVGGDDGDGDGRDVAGKAVSCSAVSAPPSRRPSSSAMVGGGTARSILNLEPFLGGGGIVPDSAADVGSPGGAAR